MENFDSLFSNQQQCSEQPFDKKQWAQQKQEKRQELYDTIDEMADRTPSEPEMLAAYIKTQARLGMTSVANTLLIAAQKPEASYVMSYDDWTQKGRSVKRGENGFFILEANGEYTREDGSLATSYDAKCVFDISQTHGKPIQQRATLSMPLRSKLKALMTDAPVPIKSSENVTESVGALYSQEDNTIYVARTSDWNKLFFVVARELAKSRAITPLSAIVPPISYVNASVFPLCRAIKSPTNFPRSMYGRSAAYSASYAKPPGI